MAERGRINRYPNVETKISDRRVVAPYASIMIKKFVSVSAVVVVSVLLAGCTAGDRSVTPAASDSAQPTSSAEPAASADPAVTEVVISTEHLTLLAADGAISSDFSYFDPAGSTVAALTAAFGSAPAVESVAPHEGNAGTSYSWEGFVLVDRDQAAERPVSLDYWVKSTASTVAGIAVRALDGTHVGSGIDEIAATYPDSIRTSDQFWDATIDRVATGLEGQAAADYGCPPDGCQLSTLYSTSDVAQGVQQILAPSENWGG